MTLDPSILTLLAFVVGTLSAYLAHKRKKNPLLWFAIGFFFGLLGMFAILFLTTPPKRPKKREPIWIIDGPKDKFWYYVDRAQEKQGPMSYDALTLAWREGRIGPVTYIWQEEWNEWKKLQETLKPIV